MDLDEKRFSMKEVATAAGGSDHVNTLNSWFQRGHFTIGAGEKKPGSGLAHRLSLRTALQARIAFELYEAADIHPATGAAIARQFTDLGDQNRNPGELFPQDFTVLVAYPKFKTGRVINCKDMTPMTEAFFGWNRGRQICATVLLLNFVDRDVRLRLLQNGKGEI